MKKVAIVVSSPMTISAFLLDQIKALSEKYFVTLIFNGKNDFSYLGKNIKSIALDLHREISLLRDLKAFFKLLQIFKKNRFDIVHSVTPKAGLLAMSASLFAGIKNRVHTFTGQVWVRKKGVIRLLLKNLDRVIAKCANRLFSDSLSQSEFLIKENVVKPNKLKVLANGSISGVDLKRFRMDKNVRSAMRYNLNLDHKDTVFLFLGRLNTDKGVLDLAKAFFELCKVQKNVKLLFVGPDEKGLKSLINKILSDYLLNVSFVDYTDKPEEYMNSADIFCLPSYREGFGSVVIEAASVGIPSIVSRIYGLTDAVVDNETGLFHEAGDINEIKAKMSQLVDDYDSRIKLGDRAQMRAKKLFPKERLTAALLDEYEMMLHE